jgi:alpha-L-rhamnosidase
MLANGATTLWERWEQATGGGMNSHNHPMMGSVGAWFYRGLAGIQADPLGPGFRRFDIRPNPVPGLDHARVALETVRGKIACGWQVSDGKMSLDLTVPVGSQARVFYPLPVGAALQEGGAILWQDEHLATDLAIQREGGDLVFTLGSGEYHFETL